MTRTAILRKILGTNLPLSPPFVRSLFISVFKFPLKVASLTVRVLAPLRKIVSRELVVFQPDTRVRHFIYSLRDRLECGHEQEHYLPDGLRELLNAYHESAVVRARRHRCHPCGAVSLKKPVQSIAAAAAQGVA